MTAHKYPVNLHQQYHAHVYFDALIPWLDEHRDGLSVLVHADTGDDILDHTEYVYWLGEPVEIDLSGL